MGKPWLASLIAMSIGLVAYFAVVRHVPNEVAVALAWANPILGAAVASYVAPRNKFNVGAATAVLAVLLIGAGTLLCRSDGLRRLRWAGGDDNRHGDFSAAHRWSVGGWRTAGRVGVQAES